MHEELECRQVTAGETEQVKRLWQVCFDDTSAFVQWYYMRYYQAKNTWGIFSNGILQASAQMIPYQLQLRQTQLSAEYVVGVDTAPEARNRGYAKQLLQVSLEEARRRKQPISLLMPFEGQFYYRYGWSFCYFHLQIQVPGSELRCATQTYGIVQEEDLFAAQPWLEQIYTVFIQFYEGFVVRTKTTWRMLLEDAALENTRCFLLRTKQKVEGYCLWTPLKDKIFIREMAWCNSNAKAGLLYFLQQSAVEHLPFWLELPAEDALSYQLATAKTAMVLYPFLMARIVDVSMLLSQLSYPLGTMQFSFAVQDDFAPWNKGIYQMHIQQGRAIVLRDEKTEPEAEITIEGLTQLVFGVRSAEQLERQGILLQNGHSYGQREKRILMSIIKKVQKKKS